jgi:hypothetical protein
MISTDGRPWVFLHSFLCTKKRNLNVRTLSPILLATERKRQERKARSRDPNTITNSIYWCTLCNRDCHSCIGLHRHSRCCFRCCFRQTAPWFYPAYFKLLSDAIHSHYWLMVAYYHYCYRNWTSQCTVLYYFHLLLYLLCQYMAWKNNVQVCSFGATQNDGFFMTQKWQKTCVVYKEVNAGSSQ